MSDPSGVRSPHLNPRALAVTRHLLMHGPASRGDLGSLLQLSDASMSRLARQLLQQGIVSENLEEPSNIGRPRQILSAIPESRHVAGIKLTADKAYAVACDLRGTELAVAEARLPAQLQGVTPVPASVKVLARLVASLERRVGGLHGIGISLGGVVTGRSVIQEGTFLGWRHVDFGGLVELATGLPVVISNDVTALAREQLWFGAGRTHATFGLITVGAGLGFGVVREGRVVEQLIDNGHLLAHSPIDAKGPLCHQGHRGCASAYLDPVAIADGTSAPNKRWLNGAARALAHLVATLAGALQTDRIVLAGENAETIFSSPVMAQTLEERLRPGPNEVQRCVLDVTTGPLSFTDWARGAGVTSIQYILGEI